MLASRKSSDFEMDTDKSFSVRWYGQYHGQTGRNRITSCLPTIRPESCVWISRAVFGDPNLLVRLSGLSRGSG